jgi:hypothetical protein
MNPYRKVIAATVGAATILVAVLPGGVTPAEALEVAVAFLTALGVYAVPNDQEIDL